ncbi:MAG: hypothetical protein ABI456_14400 [Ktedonobacteraceae bacterium]
MSESAQIPYTIPTHLNVPDRIIGPFTPRGLMLFLLGSALGYNLWTQIGTWHLGGATWVLVLRLCVSGLPVVVGLALALVSVAGRSLDVWALILLCWLRQSRRCVWRSVCQQDVFALPVSPSQDDTEGASSSPHQQKEEGCL